MKILSSIVALSALTATASLANSTAPLGISEPQTPVVEVQPASPEVAPIPQIAPAPLTDAEIVQLEAPEVLPATNRVVELEAIPTAVEPAISQSAGVTGPDYTFALD